MGVKPARVLGPEVSCGVCGDELIPSGSRYKLTGVIPETNYIRTLLGFRARVPAFQHGRGNHRDNKCWNYGEEWPCYERDGD